MPDVWTLPELVAEVAARIAALPAPRNGQVRAIPDERTVRYYGTIGLLDRPSAMRGRTALYGAKHVAQVVAIKRLQTMGRSLSEIQALWPTLDEPTLARMSGVELAAAPRPAVRAEFWKREAHADEQRRDKLPAREGFARDSRGSDDVFAHEGGMGEGLTRAEAPDGEPVRALRVELAPGVTLLLAVADDAVAIASADVRAIRAAAAPLLAELASRRLASHSGGEEP